ncbi:hypothetical protein BKA60DRAFT_611097 [Fusarium oxysporum]|nr:hypothetical protein BKA60DRAFT_611097 [Fusarium oxysporum]
MDLDTMDSPSSIEEVMYLDRMNDSSAKTKVHVYITPECGLCDQIIHANEWTVACENRKPLYILPRVASAWKFPWRHRPPQRKPRLDLTDTTLVSIGGPVAEAICIPGLASLPQEVLQMVRSYIPSNLLWRYSLIQGTAEEMSRPFQNLLEPEQDATRFSLAAVKAWKRGVQGMDAACDESEAELFIVRLTVDCLGLKEIQRLQDWPGYNHIRSNTCAYVFFTQGQANSSFISSKFGRAFIENPHDSRAFQFWDTPSPPLRGLKMFPRPDRPGSIRYRTVDLLNTTGLTFFFLRGFIMAVHPHTANSPVAAPTIQHFSRYGRTSLYPICTKLTGTFLIGPYQCYTDTDDVSGNEPSVLVHNVPTKRVGGSLGIVTEHNFESESLLSFPRYHKDDKDPSGLRCINTEVPAKNITHADVYYNRRNGYCKGLLLEYANGAQRAVGQCRIGIDPFKAYGKPSWICYRDICDPETCEETGSCIVECTTGTNSHEHEPRDIGDWVCMRPRGGGYLEFACEHKTASFECGLCCQTIHPDEWAIALLNHHMKMYEGRPEYCTKRFRFPRTPGAITDTDWFPLCNLVECRDFRWSPESVTLHADCYCLFLQTYREKPVLERLWVAAVWRTPWIVSSLKPSTQLDIVDNGLVSISLSTAEILGLPQLTTLPSEVLQLIRAYSRGSFIWTYPAIKAKAEEMARFDESMSKDDGMQHNLRIVKEWHRGQDTELDEDPPESGVFRFTLDSNGLLERLSDWPEYKSCRYRTHKYFFIDSAEAQRTWVYFKFGHARMILSPSWSRPFQFWDIPSPPTKGLEVLLRPRRTDATCNRTLDLRNITGITFFFYRGTLMGLHAHTLGAVTAVSTVKDTLSDYEPHLVWIHIPIPHGDHIMRFGLRTWRNEHEEPANHHTALLMTTKLAGDFSLGPSFDMEDQNFLFQGTPTVLVHNTPGKGGITLLGIAGDEPQETLPAPRFPVISLSPYELAYGGNAITVDISLKGTVRVDIFKDSSTGCFRGFLLEYENGSQRAAGQCRVGVDPVTVCHKPVSFCYRKVQGGDFDVHKYSELKYYPETGDPHYDHASPDGAWTCSDFGVYAKVWCNDVTTELYTYTPRSQEFITIED